jgi:hypothetical protein
MWQRCHMAPIVVSHGVIQLLDGSAAVVPKSTPRDDAPVLPRGSPLGIFRIRTHLTPLAAQGLAVIMIGAIITTVATMNASMAVVPLIVGLLAGTVAYGRGRVAPLTRRSNRPSLHPAV